ETIAIGALSTPARLAETTNHGELSGLEPWLVGVEGAGRSVELGVPTPSGGWSTEVARQRCGYEHESEPQCDTSHRSEDANAHHIARSIAVIAERGVQGNIIVKLLERIPQARSDNPGAPRPPRGWRALVPFPHGAGLSAGYSWPLRGSEGRTTRGGSGEVE